LFVNNLGITRTTFDVEVASENEPEDEPIMPRQKYNKKGGGGEKKVSK